MSDQSTLGQLPRRNRRSFFYDLGRAVYAVALGIVLYPVARFILRERDAVNRVIVGEVAAFAPNSGHHFQMGDDLGLLIVDNAGEFQAFNARCTHKGCTVEYQPNPAHIHCPCHDGRYDLSGQTVSGPPTRPLTQLVVTLEDGQVVVSRS